MSTLSTHVLDTGLGKPAPGIRVTLEHEGTVLGSAVTDADGRVRDLIPKDPPLAAGHYRLIFSVAEYFQSAGRETLWVDIVAQLRIGAGREHYHVPLLLGPFTYTIYRGS
jgi:5-hydroxyisourate hydrolase